MDLHSHLSNAEPAAVEALYRQFLEDPSLVDPSWRHFFLGFDFAQRIYGEETLTSGGGAAESGQAGTSAMGPKEFRVINLIHAYRTRGHLFTKTNPVRARRDYSPDLGIAHFGLEESDMDTVFEAGSEVGIGAASLRDIIAHLEATYCHSIGIEYMYMREPERWSWFKDHIELANRPVLGKEEKQQIFRKLNQATVFEEFLQKKFVGQKRFSVEGGESLLPALDAIVERGSELGAKEFIIGMAHRGRLNTLAHILNKPYADIFEEFAGKAYDNGDDFDGDVKYHMGYSTDLTADNGNPVHITLAPNPSHLEAVDPVVEGIARARIDRGHQNEDAVVPILVHGDAALSGQGVVYEVVQMAQLDGYRTGGTIHLVVNNQVGFTTNYLDGRSSIYCTDVAKATHCPVFHVNADDAEAVVTAVRIALEYRQRWHRDVFIDLLGYRKYGHNEGDEPKFTQPKLYKAIQRHPNARELYLQQLEGEGLMDRATADGMRAELESQLDAAMEQAKGAGKIYVTNFLEKLWGDFRMKKPGDDAMEVWTGFDRTRLGQLAESGAVKSGPHLHGIIAGLFHPEISPQLLQEVGHINLACSLGLLHRRIKLRFELGAHAIRRGAVHEALALQLLQVELPGIRMPLNGLVELGLGEFGFVALVVAVLPVAEQVDEDVTVPALAVFQRDADGGHHGLGIVRIDVEDRTVGRLGDIGAIDTGTAVQVVCGKTDLVVDHQVDGASGAVSIELGHLDHLIHHPLSGQCRVTMHEDGHDGVLILMAPVDPRPGDALHDRIHRLEV